MHAASLKKSSLPYCGCAAAIFVSVTLCRLMVELWPEVRSKPIHGQADLTLDNRFDHE
jgi:hypothetical protein